MKSAVLFLFIFCYLSVSAQSDSNVYHISKTAEAIQLDGHLTEKAWKQAEKKGQFIQHYPYDTSKAFTSTEFMLVYDDEAVYCAMICVNRNPDKDFVLQTLKRDFSITNSDAAILSISPFVDG